MAEHHWSARDWTIAFIAWSALAVLSLLQTAVYLGQRGQPIPWLPLAASRLADWYTCFAFAPAYVRLIRRYAADDRPRWPAALVLLGATVVFVPVKYAILMPVMQAIVPETRSATLGAVVRDNFFTEMLFLGGLALAIYTVDLYRGVQRSRIEAARLGRELAEARLDALTMQLQPHFLFNTLNSVLALIKRDPRAAEDMLGELSALLQRTLRGERREVTLAAELDELQLYLDIMRRRFGDRLTTRCEVHDDAQRALVPRFLLQPIVENAIAHGFAADGGIGVITIGAAVRGPRLEIEVADNGPGFSPTRAARTNGGMGLSNTRRRLEQLYAADFDLSIHADDAGTRVRISVPCRTESAA